MKPHELLAGCERADIGMRPDDVDGEACPAEAKAFEVWRKARQKRSVARRAANARRRAEDLTIVMVEDVPKHVSKVFRSEARALLAELVVSNRDQRSKTRPPVEPRRWSRWCTP